MTKQPQAVPHGRWVLVTTILASSMAFIDGTALNVALDALQKDLHATGPELIWVINAYLLLLASLLLFGGTLGDRVGRNRVFGTGIILFSTASFVCGIAPSIGILIGARAIQGIGGALMVPGSLAIISASFPAEERGQAIGIWSAAGTITTISGPLLGGVLANAGLWRAVFFINVPLAVAALYSLTHVPESRDEAAPRQLDYPGTLLVVLGLAALTYGAISLGQQGNSLALAALAVGAAALGGFIWVERHSDHPLVDLKLFRSRTFSGTNLMTALLYGALSGALLFFPLNLIQAQGYPASTVGLAFLPFPLALAALSTRTGPLLTRFGPRVLLTVGPILIGVGFVLLALPGITHGPQDYWTTYFPGILVIGIGMGLTVAPLTTTVMGSVPPSHAGLASGISNAVTRSAQVLATAILGTVALSAFSAALNTRVTALELPPQAAQSLQQEAVNFGNARVPESLNPADQARVKDAIRESFVETFQRIALISAGLCLLSALVSALFISSKLEIVQDSYAETPAPQT